MYQSKLKRHIVRKHKDNETVAKALKLPKKEQAKFFRKQINIGTMQTNIEESGKAHPKFERMRKTKDQEKEGALVMCYECNIFIKRSGMAKHKRSCSGSCFMDSRLLISSPTTETSTDFKSHILATLRNDDIGIKCKTDPTILTAGYWSYQRLKKNDNKVGSRDAVRKDMRYLAHCYYHFLRLNPSTQLYSNSKDMFLIQNFSTLAKAIESYCSDGDDLKPGLKHGLQYAIISAVKILKAVAFTKGSDDEASQLEKFQSVFKLWENTIFGDAVLKLKRSSDTKARKPQELPVEEDIKKLRDYSISIINDFVKNPSAQNFIKARNAACARLTLFNGRRGGEPARLLRSDLNEAMADTWIDQNFIKTVDQLDRVLIESLKVTYQAGKGNRLVPILFPKDTIDALRLLTDETLRSQCGISKENIYVFAPTKNSLKHVSGWHCLQDLCSDLELLSSSRITATKNRHRMSTLYATLEMSQHEKEAFFNHMGHSESMSKNKYQCPLAIQEVTKVGKFFNQVDQGIFLVLTFMKSFLYIYLSRIASSALLNCYP